MNELTPTNSLVGGFTCGTFDLLHPGHVHMLEWAKQHCDYLIVGLQTNPTIDRPDTKNVPAQTTFERWMQLRSVRYVDEIVPYDTEQDLRNILSILNINVRIVGGDYTIGSNLLTGEDICKSRNIRILRAPRLHSFSSSELRRRILKMD